VLFFFCSRDGNVPNIPSFDGFVFVTMTDCGVLDINNVEMKWCESQLTRSAVTLAACITLVSSLTATRYCFRWSGKGETSYIEESTPAHVCFVSEASVLTTRHALTINYPSSLLPFTLQNSYSLLHVLSEMFAFNLCFSPISFLDTQQDILWRLKPVICKGICCRL
jgi:hypothetical protein